jgi:excinuclease ABC subunit C
MVKTQNDIACLKEIIKRRFSHLPERSEGWQMKANSEGGKLHRTEWRLPDLIYVDGGKGQFNAAKSIIERHNFKIPVISLAKKKNILYNTNYTNSKKPISLDKLPQIVKMTILYLRDEAHRFAISYHKKLRSHEFM